LNWAKTSILSFAIPSNISYFWNFGSFAGIVLVLQVITGLLLSFTYIPIVPETFFWVNLNRKDYFWWFLLRILHLNFASLFFIAVYFHFLRGIYYKSFIKTIVWSSGVTILILLMAAAFLGYTLPYGRISFWGATVITNFFSAIPVIGGKLVIFLWGGYGVGQSTISFFYSLHYLVPFILIVVALLHLIFLHETGSKSKIFLRNKNKGFLIEFNNYLLQKDLINLLIITVFLILVLVFPFVLGDVENFILANPLSSPLHIKPEWYFLFLYAILRAIPNKLGGVVAIAISLVLFYFFPFKKVYNNIKRMKLTFYLSLCTLFLLTWLGGSPVEFPYVTISQIFTTLYFILIIII